MRDYEEVLAPNKYYDRTFEREAVKLLPGEYYATARDMLLVTVLGSCVAACLRDLMRGIGNPTSVAEAGIDSAAYEAQLDKMVEDAFNDTQIITAARAPAYEELRQIFLYAYDGRLVDF